MTDLPHWSTPGKWSVNNKLDLVRSHSPVIAYKDLVYVFGGGSYEFASMDSVVAYDPATNSWRDCAPMPRKRSGTVAFLHDDKIYLIGGGFKQENGQFRFLEDVDIYYPDRDVWETGPSMTQPHDYPAGAYLDGYYYVLGGHHPDATKGGPKTDPGFDYCERLNIATGEWEVIAPLPTPRFALAGAVVDGKIWAMGGVAFRPEGFDNFTVIEVFDPATGVWTEEPDLALPWQAAGLGAFMYNDELYIFGGYSGDGIHERVAKMTMNDRQWHLLASMPEPLAAMGIDELDGKLYLAGGWADDARVPQNSFFILDPAAK